MGFTTGRMLTPQEQEVKFRLTQSHNQTWQKDCGEGAALGEGRKQQLLVHQPESKALRLHNTAVRTLQSERTTSSVC